MITKRLAVATCAFLVGFFGHITAGSAQEQLPADNGMSTYHTAPRYRESESHPLRVLAYIVHPIGWIAREVLFRPLSYFASSTETTRSVMGYREPFDFRQPICFVADAQIPDCRGVVPFNYDQPAGVSGFKGKGVSSVEAKEAAAVAGAERAVYFPDVNFDFNSRSLTQLGRSKVSQIALMLNDDRGVRVVLQGHTDYKGTDGYNQKLGMDRAEAVRNELLKLGVSPERLSTMSFGSSQPLFEEKEEWANAANRRVEVRVGDQGAEQPQTAPVAKLAE